MRFIKLAFFSIVVLFTIVTLISLMFPSTAKVSRAIDIMAPSANVHALVNNVGKWKTWLSGINQFAILSKDSVGQGAIASIENSRVFILKSNADTIVTEWIGASGGKQTGVFVFIKQPNNITTVQWYFEQKLSWFPWEKFGSMFNDKILGSVLEKNLDGLKGAAEMPR